jgi:hypothetical protein
MMVGDVVSTRNIVVVQSRMTLTFRARKGKLFHFLLLGETAPDEDFDPVAALHSLGWSLPEGEEVIGKSSVPLTELLAASPTDMETET